MQYQRIAIVMVFLMLFSAGLASAAVEKPITGKRFIALAVHLDTPKQDRSGFSNLNEKMIETIAARLNTMAVNQIIVGSGVIEKLKEFGVENLDSAEPNRLSAYGREHNISYIVMFSLKTSDFSYSLKAFDVGKGTFLYDGATKNQVVETSLSWSLSDFSLSPTELFMKKIVPALDEQLTELLKLLR